MNILLIILLSQFVFINGGNLLTRPLSRPRNRLRYDCSVPKSDRSSLPPDYLKIKIKKQCEVLHHVNLKQTKRVLANENLPIWILRGLVESTSLDIGDGHELHRNYEVMKQLGRFTTYHEPETSSAAIYFHERREFDGMINYEFLIRRLSVIRNCRGPRTFPLGLPGIYRRPDYVKHQSDSVIQDSASGVNDQRQRKTYGGHVFDGYPEVLVIVSADATKFWTQNVLEADWYTTVVSNVLTLFNGIDMLYSKLDKTKIQINIAGIIIGLEEESLFFLHDCYYFDITANESNKHKLDGGCINGRFRRYLAARKKIIPIESYDMVIYLTKEDIFQVRSKGGIDEGRIFLPAYGISSVMFELYEMRKYDLETILVGTISVLEHMGSYPTIAHEMAHLMTLRHDLPPFFTGDGECCAGIMKSMGDHCDRCISWSEISVQSFQYFFSSPNCCIFINKPRSLHPPGRHQLITAEEQCKCHGYKSAREYEELPYSYCDIHLECNGDDDAVHRTPIPMDGTLCGNEEVCYERTCQEIKVFKPTLSLK